MRPYLAFVDEALQVQRRGHRTGHARAGIGQVGDAAVEVTQVRTPQRHAPDRVAGAVTGLQPLVGQGVVIGEQGRQVRAQRDARGTGEGGEIKDGVRVLLADIGQCVAQHQTAFGVGVVDLHGEALAGGDHFAGTERIRANRVLDRCHHQGQLHRQLLRHHQTRQCDGMGSAAHVLFHVAHAIGRLQVQAAGVEAHALANQRQMRRTGGAPAQHDQARRAVRGAAYRMDGGEVHLQQFVAGNHFQLAAMRIGQFARGVFQLLRAHVFGGRVDPVAHAQAGDHHVQHFGGRRCQQLRGRAGQLAVAVEAVAAQAPADLQVGGAAGIQFIGELPAGAGRQRERCMRIGIGVGVIAHAQYRAGNAVVTWQQQHAAGRAVELLRAGPGLHGGRLLRLPGGKAIAVEHVQRQGVGGIGGVSGNRGHGVL